MLRRSFGAISDDQRIQAVIIAFCFGALMEALAGFGTPVAITAVMLIALGFQPIKAAAIALVANTAPVAFGAIATPIITLSEVTGLDKGDLGAMVGRQTPFLALIVPLILIGMVDGRRGIRQAWPVAVVGGLTFALGQFLCSNFISVELTDIVAALRRTGAIVAFLRFWQPGEPLLAEDARHRALPAAGRRRRLGARPGDGARGRAPRRHAEDSTADVVSAYAPYLIIIAVFSIAQIPAVKDWLAESPWTTTFQWPGSTCEPRRRAAQQPDVQLQLAARRRHADADLRPDHDGRDRAVARPRAVRVFGATLDQLKWAIVTVAAVLALAYVMNQSGQTITLGLWAAGAGAFFAFLSAMIGWLGVAVTGSDTSSNALFGALQVTAAKDAGLSPTLLAAANSSGGVLGKMISPQNLAIGAAAVGLAGRRATCSVRCSAGASC